MNTNRHLIYRLVLLSASHFSAEKVRDISEDYEEYLNQKDPSENLESPWQFYTAIIREERGYRPKAKTIFAVLAAALLIFCNIWRANFASQSLMAFGLPLAIWTAIGGTTAARYSPQHPHAMLCVLLPPLSITILAAGCLLFIDAVVTGAIHIRTDTARLFHTVLRGCLIASLILFLASACQLWRNSIWYFCPMTQAVSGWCYFKSVHLILTRMDLPAQPLTEHYFCLLPLALGLATSLAFAFLIRKLTERGNTQWTDK